MGIERENYRYLNTITHIRAGEHVVFGEAPDLRERGTLIVELNKAAAADAADVPSVARFRIRAGRFSKSTASETASLNVRLIGEKFPVIVTAEDSARKIVAFLVVEDVELGAEPTVLDLREAVWRTNFRDVQLIAENATWDGALYLSARGYRADERRVNSFAKSFPISSGAQRSTRAGSLARAPTLRRLISKAPKTDPKSRLTVALEQRSRFRLAAKRRHFGSTSGENAFYRTHRHHLDVRANNRLGRGRRRASCGPAGYAQATYFTVEARAFEGTYGVG